MNESHRGTHRRRDDVIEMFKEIKGIGETYAIEMYDSLHLRTIEDIVEAAESGELRHIAGIGERKERSILIEAREALGIEEAKVDHDSIESIESIEEESIDQVGPTIQTDTSEVMAARDESWEERGREGERRSVSDPTRCHGECPEVSEEEKEIPESLKTQEVTVDNAPTIQYPRDTIEAHDATEQNQEITKEEERPTESISVTEEKPEKPKRSARSRIFKAAKQIAKSGVRRLLQLAKSK